MYGVYVCVFLQGSSATQTGSECTRRGEKARPLDRGKYGFSWGKPGQRTSIIL